MKLYFERFDLSSFIYVLKKRFTSKEHSKIFFIDINPNHEKFYLMVLRKLGVKIEKFNFRLRDIKDPDGELIRIKINREMIFDLNKIIIESDEYRTITKELYSKGNFNHEITSFIEKSLTESSCMVPGHARSLLIIEAIKKNDDDQNKIIFLEKIPWSDSLRELYKKNNLNIIFKKKKILKLSLNFKDFLKNYPRIFFISKIFHNLKFSNLKSLKSNNLFLDGRGDLVFEKNELHSDFFWFFDSNFKPERILYEYKNEGEKNLLSKNNFTPIKLLPNFRDLKTKIFSAKIGKLKRKVYETKLLKKFTNLYKSSFLFYSSVFKKLNVKIYFSWMKYTADHIALSAAVRKNGGISVNWQMAFDGYKNFENRAFFDVIFSFSQFSANLDKKIDSSFTYNIVTGFPKSFISEKVKLKANEVRNKILASGAKNIVCVLDENSVDDERWHTGHPVQRENYYFIIEQLLKDKNLGVVFKPKRSIDLRERMGDEISGLIDKSIETGRCHIFEESARYTTAAAPSVAILSSDLCIHSHLSSGTGALESALLKIPTILIDREGCPKSKFYELKEGKVIFKDWQSAIMGFNNFFKDKKKDLEFGNFSDFLDIIEPFQDEQGGKRIGDFLSSLIEGFDLGLSRNDTMARAVDIYSKAWGEDKVIKSVNNF